MAAAEMAGRAPAAAPPVAVVALTAKGARLARRIADALGAAEAAAEVHALAARVPLENITAEVMFDQAAPHLRELFEAGCPIIGVCAAGILVRCLAPLLDDKHAEPPVLAVSEDGAFVVPLLGAHRHGGVELARRVADIVGGAAAITTASERRFAIALDAPPDGWTLANPADVKAFTAELLAGERVRLPPASSLTAWLAASELPSDPAGTLAILETDANTPGGANTLVYHPRRLALGIGCERGASSDEVAQLALGCLERAGLAPQAVAGVFSLDRKMDEPAVHALAAKLEAPARFFDAPTLEAETPRLRTPSEEVFRITGCHGVAEGAALAAVGAAGELVVAKTTSKRATCAIARAPEPIRADAIGLPRGELHVVGLGPGDAGTLTPDARAAIATARHVVGYRRYLDLAAALIPERQRGGAEEHAYELGEERERVARAIALAASGERVTLVCSGDAGIYALATLVMEHLDRVATAEERRIEVRVLPGVSALQTAAARVGAPLGHDFCAISLSDLLTPPEVIEARLVAALDADFVLALYNPASATRRELFGRALELARARRAAATPVIVARNLGRAGERVEVTTLGALAPERVDMLTTVLIGASATRAFPLGDGAERVYTPRGYEVRGADKDKGGAA